MTAVEWLFEQVVNRTERVYFLKELEQAKEMEKQQIIDAWNDVGADGITTAEEYYINNFKSE
jgi:hypothetical protein